MGCLQIKAEAGVFRGDTAAIINKVFYDRKLYLFDTFEGFSIKDIAIEKRNSYSNANEGMFGNTSEQIVIEKMMHPENCIITKGIFPESAKKINDVFVFARLDLDLYSPTIDGLKWFGERMQHGGIITIDDYYLASYAGVKAAVDEYLADRKQLIKVAAGDGGVLLLGF